VNDKISVEDGQCLATPAHIEMVQMLVKQAQKAGTFTLAEGIEVAEDVKVCRELGFDFVQGFYFGRPLDSNIQLSIPPHLI
jgi:EAL domain-containing protein (putative c-di-GMP-specific phosphodiesterase class I)